MKIHLILVVMILFSSIVIFIPHENVRASAAWYNDSWLYSKRIVIDHTKVSATLSNFPMLFDNTSGSYSKAQVDGDDFVFVAAGNLTKYNHEIETFNVTTYRLIAWVNITSLSSVTDTTLWLYYGNPSCSNQESANTWDSDYKAVYHMNDPTGTALIDSKSVHNATTTSAPTYHASGKVGYACDFETDTSQFFEIGSSSDLDGLSAITIEFWMKLESNDDGGLVTRVKGFGYGDQAWWLYYYNSPPYVKFQMSHSSPSNSEQSAVLVGAYIGGWAHMVASYSTNTKLNLYRNGSLGAQSATIFSGMLDISANSYIGQMQSAYFFDGILDEIRISKSKRSADWILTEYRNQNMSSTFCSVSNEFILDSIVYTAQYPVAGSITQIPRPWISVTIYCTNSPRYTMNLTFMVNLSGSWRTLGRNTSVVNGTYRQYFINLTMANKKVFWRVNTSNGRGAYFNTTYNFTTGLCNLTVTNIYDIVNAEGTTQYAYNPVTGFTTWSNYTGNTTGLTYHNNTKNTTGTIQAKLFSTGWHVYTNLTGNTTAVTLHNHNINSTGTLTNFLFTDGWHIYANDTGNTTPVTLMENIVNATGTHEYILNSTGYYIWANYTGDTTPLFLFENIVNATGTHTSELTSAGYTVYANYTGTGNGTGGNVTYIPLNKNCRYVVYLILGAFFGFMAFGVIGDPFRKHKKKI